MASDDAKPASPPAAADPPAADAEDAAPADAKEETWMLFLGGDAEAKERVARELASLVFGSRNSVVSIRPGGASSSPSASGSSEDHRSKRPRTPPPAAPFPSPP